jgi:hypothetical protein
MHYYYLDRLCFLCNEIIGVRKRVPIPDELTQKIHYLHDPDCAEAVRHLMEQEYRCLMIRLFNRRLE